MAGRRINRLWTAALVCLASCLALCRAGASGELPAPPAGTTLRAAVYVSEPFVMRADLGRYTGMAVELWEAAAQNIGVETVYIPYDSWGGMLQAVMSGDADVGVGAITVSHRRAESMHFSFPWYDSGMRIMKKADSVSFWKEMLNSQRFRVYGMFGLVFLLLALLMTWFRRKKDPEFPRDVKSGYTLSLLDITSSVRCGELNQEYLGWKGHILSALWMMFGMAIVAYVTSTMTTAMTTATLDADGIYGLGDLPGNKVAGLRGGMSARYLRELRLDVVGCKNMEEAVELLQKGKVRAMVSDAPVLEHWVHTHPEQNLEVVGDLFHHDKYAFAAHPSKARIMDQITVQLIRMTEQGEVGKLKRKYLGESHGYWSF